MSSSRSASRPAGRLPGVDPARERPPGREERRALARLAAAVAARDDRAVEREAARLSGRLARRCAEETVLQTYLFAGFPAAINGFAALERAWPPERADAPARDGREPGPDPAGWKARGERLCARVYGPRYRRLRARMRALSPALDDWMVVEGYGKTLSRPGLDEATREICAVAALAALGATRQLEAHLEGARRLGADPVLIDEAARDAVRRHVPRARRAELESLLAPPRRPSRGARP
ncbi:MAG TPA: carboxymuconolactone decarboxylase family protein [Gemmatimonadota bacterium]|jgi:4-carboxymuconolactone decarboxylase